MDADQVRSLRPAMGAFVSRYKGDFNRAATFGHFQWYLLGLLTDLERKSVEPIALAAGVAVRTLQEFLAFFKWDHAKVRGQVQRDVADMHGAPGSGAACGSTSGGAPASAPASGGIGVIDASGHAKRGDMTPGVQWQYCGETGKVDNCVVGQHLLYTDNDATNPFTCVLASDLYLPKSWAEDRERCRVAGIPDELIYRPKWKIALEQVAEAIGRGVRFEYLTFDEEYGSVPDFWFALDRLGQRGVGEVKCNFTGWVVRPAYRSLRAEHAPRRVDHLVTHSPVFRGQPWKTMKIKDSTRGPIIWEYKHAMPHLPRHDKNAPGSPALPTDRRYWLVVARHPRTGEVKYLVSNAAAHVPVEQLLRAAFARWHVEKWFERAKQECGLGAFEVRTYTSLMRHWLCASLAMLFLAEQTTRLRGEKSADHLRAGRPRRQHPGVGDLEPLVAQLV